MFELKQVATDKVIPFFFFFSSTDHIARATGLAPSAAIVGTETESGDE